MQAIERLHFGEAFRIWGRVSPQNSIAPFQSHQIQKPSQAFPSSLNFLQHGQAIGQCVANTDGLDGISQLREFEVNRVKSVFQQRGIASLTLDLPQRLSELRCDVRKDLFTKKHFRSVCCKLSPDLRLRYTGLKGITDIPREKHLALSTPYALD